MFSNVFDIGLAPTNLENDPGTHISASGKHNVTYILNYSIMDDTILDEWKRLHTYGVITESSQVVVVVFLARNESRRMPAMTALKPTGFVCYHIHYKWSPRDEDSELLLYLNFLSPSYLNLVCSDQPTSSSQHYSLRNGKTQGALEKAVE